MIQFIVMLHLLIFASILGCSNLQSTSEKKVTEKLISPVINLDSLSLNERVVQLKEFKSKLTLGSEFHQKYFDVFPDDFVTFMAVFGYDGKVDGPLYENSMEYISIFFKKLEIDRKLVFKKTLNIAKNARWQADGVGHFRYLMVAFSPGYNKITNVEELKILINILKEGSDQDVEGFWYFYFDGEHPPKEIYPALGDFVKSQDSRVYELMQQGHKKALAGYDGHGLPPDK